MPAPVFLCGMMGAGKSTVGRLLASTLGCAFIDLDARIERICGQSVRALFEGGESYFRKWERAALVSLLSEPGFCDQASVVATGGGVVVHPHNLDDMLAAGTTVYLEVEPRELARRLQATPSELRPLLSDEGWHGDHLEQLLKDRRSRYETCAVIVNGNASPVEIAQSIERTLRGPARELPR